jgi:two-component system response regulator AgrA
MVKIFICENNEMQRNYIKEQIKSIADTKELNMEIAVETNTPEDIIDYINKNKDTDTGVYFLDICFNYNKSGTCFPQEIKRYDPKALIIFITENWEMSCMNYFYSCEKAFDIKVDNRIIRVEFNKIIFFETSNTKRKVVMHTLDGQIEFYAQIKELQEKLDARFYRWHRAYLINKDYIKEIDKRKRIVYMTNGESCCISFRALKNL